MGTRQCTGCLDIDNFFYEPVWRQKGAEGWKGALEFHTGKILSVELLSVPLYLLTSHIVFVLRIVRKWTQERENGRKSTVVKYQTDQVAHFGEVQLYFG